MVALSTRRRRFTRHSEYNEGSFFQRAGHPIPYFCEVLATDSLCAGHSLLFRPRPKLKSPSPSLVVDNPLVPQLLQELADVGANLRRVRVAELSLQFCDDLGEGALAVATLEDLTACALEFHCAFGEQDHACFFCAAPAASGGQAGLTGVFGRGH